MNETTAKPFPAALLTVIGIVTMLFAAFSASYIIRKANADWQTLPLPMMVWVGMAILAAASLALEWRRLDAALVASLAFVITQLFAWLDLAGSGVFLSTSPGAAFYYVLTGLHAAHVVGGTGALLYARSHPGAFRSCATYWHFLGFLWLYVLILLSVV
jgi:cytochrome c oxidase subunit 3